MKALAILATAGVVALIVIADLGYGGRAFGWLAHVPGRDLTAHFVIFSALAWAVHSYATRATTRPLCGVHARLAAVLATIVSLEEWSQAFLATRTFSPADLYASLGGLATGALLSLVVVRRDADARPITR